MSKLQLNDKTFIYILEKVRECFFLKKITSYHYKIDIENQLIFRAQFTYTVIYLEVKRHTCPGSCCKHTANYLIISKIINMRRTIKTCKHTSIVKVYMTERIFSFIVSMVCSVAYKCKTMSNQWICMFEFPEDDKRRKVWTPRVKVNDFITSKSSRLCAKHFANAGLW